MIEMIIQKVHLFSDGQHFVVVLQNVNVQNQTSGLHNWKSGWEVILNLSAKLRPTVHAVIYRARWSKDNTKELTTSQILEHYPRLTTNGMVRA